MSLHPHYLIALAAAMAYALATLLGKRATQEGAGTLRLAAAGIIAHPLCFWPLLLFTDTQVDWSLVGWPLLGAVGMAGGFICVAGAIKLGDVSIQTPLAGTKALFVAALVAAFTAAPVPLTWWIGAAMTAVGVVVIGLPELLRRRGSSLSVGLALLSTVMFAGTDTLVQTYSHAFGPTPFIMVVLSGASLIVAIVAPLIQPGLWRVPRSTWWWLAGFAIIMGCQGASFGLALALWGDATALNIVYATRGFWSITLVWFIGRWLGNTERDRGWKVMALRLVGAALLFAAVVLVLMQSPPEV